MLFIHFARADSLREISYEHACCIGKLSHLGMKKAPLKSTLGYATANRPVEIFEALVFSFLPALNPRKMLGVRIPFKYRNKLATSDFVTITLALEGFPWAEYLSEMGGVRLHSLFLVLLPMSVRLS